MKDETGYCILITLELSNVFGKLELDTIALLTLINRTLFNKAYPVIQLSFKHTINRLKFV